ncbi:hypothetical protein BC940DRAFT_290942 [Gongronella butleri]|nr:hypothetical protein BC940DRAFT_290942 [Gongronella butleri]
MAIDPLAQARLDSAQQGSSRSFQLPWAATPEPPSRDHWKPDAEVMQCELEGCDVLFGLLDRRHHCRRCGHIFCSRHCSNYIRLDHYCQFDMDGGLSRGCDRCVRDYHAWRQPKLAFTPPPPTSEDVDADDDDASISVTSSNINIRRSSRKPSQDANAPLQSVPANWQWSTF